MMERRLLGDHVVSGSAARRAADALSRSRYRRLARGRRENRPAPAQGRILSPFGPSTPTLVSAHEGSWPA